MAELTIRPEDITSALKRHVDGFKPSTEREEVGRVDEVGDGIRASLDCRASWRTRCSSSRVASSDWR